MTADETRAFLQDNHHAVLVTRRANGGLQSSPVVCGVDDEGYAVISVTVDRAKAKNIRRDPSVNLCVFTDGFFGPWVQVEGDAHIVDLPAAMDGLKALYRSVAGEHDDWDDYEAAMVRDGRCLIRIPIT